MSDHPTRLVLLEEVRRGDVVRLPFGLEVTVDHVREGVVFGHYGAGFVAAWPVDDVEIVRRAER